MRNGKVIPLRLAAGDVAGTQAAVEQVKAQFGKVDVLILNAGMLETLWVVHSFNESDLSARLAPF